MPTASNDTSGSRLQILPTGDLIGHAVPVADLISLAYDVPENPSPRISALPDWTVRQHFDIQASVSSSLKLDSRDIATQKRFIAQLLQSLLADRFGLVLKVRSQRMPVYALAAIHENPKLNKASVTSTSCIFDTEPAGCHTFAIGFGHPLNGNAVDFSDLAHYLENWTDQPVVNNLPLTALYTMHSPGWKPMNLPPPPPGAVSTGNEFARLSSLSAVLANLGLRLLQRQQVLPLYTIESLHQPRAN